MRLRSKLCFAQKQQRYTFHLPIPHRTLLTLNLHPCTIYIKVVWREDSLLKMWKVPLPHPVYFTVVGIQCYLFIITVVEVYATYYLVFQARYLQTLQSPISLNPSYFHLEMKNGLIQRWEVCSLKCGLNRWTREGHQHRIHISTVPITSNESL